MHSIKNIILSSKKCAIWHSQGVRDTPIRLTLPGGYYLSRVQHRNKPIIELTEKKINKKSTIEFSFLKARTHYGRYYFK